MPKMTEQEKLAWWAANKAKAAVKAKEKADRLERLNRETNESNDPNSEFNKQLRQWH